MNSLIFVAYVVSDYARFDEAKNYVTISLMKELDLAEKVASMSTGELSAWRNQVATRLKEAQYSEDEIRQVQESLSSGSNPYTPEFAREILFVSDVLEQQAIAEELKKRSGAA